MTKAFIIIIAAACSAFILACFIIGFWKLVASDKKRKKVVDGNFFHKMTKIDFKTDCSLDDHENAISK